MNLQEEYNLCDRENSNLRKHLLWAAQFLSPAQRVELRDRLKAPIEEGGVTSDLQAEDRAEMLERDKAIESLTDHVQTAVDRGIINSAWLIRADNLANSLREYLSKADAPLTFHELLNGKA